MLFATAVGIFGVIIDHHYADRQPWHDHISLNQAVGDHGHNYGLDHHHDSGPVQATSDQVTITATYASGAYWALLCLGIMLFACLLSIGAPPLEVSRRIREYLPLKPISVAPPQRPPI